MSNEIFSRSIKDSRTLLEFNRRIRETKDEGYKAHLIEQRNSFEKMLEEEFEEKQMEKFLKEISGFDEFA
jgi:hypothetical protein